MTFNEAYGIMGHGQPLCLPHSGVPAFFAATLKGHVEIPCPPELVEQLVKSLLTSKITEKGEPPMDDPGARKAGMGWRNGWRELNWPGDHCDFYVCTQ